MVEQGIAPVAGGLEDEFFRRSRIKSGMRGVKPGGFDPIAVSQVAGYGNLVGGIFGEGHADGIADSFLQERGNGHAGLDAAAVTVAGFRYADMQREHDAAFLHHAGQFAVGLHHDHRIGGLQRHHHIIELGIHTHLHPFHGSEGHGLRRIAILLHNVLAQRTMVQADADGTVILLALFQKLPEEQAGLLMVRMEVTRIDADFLHHRNHGHGHFRREMDIGHQRRLNALGTQGIVDLLQGGYVRQGRDGDADELRAHRRQPPTLRHGCGNIGRMGIAHGLDHDRVAASDKDIAHADGPGFHSFCHCLFCCSSIIFLASLRSCPRVWPYRGVS